MKILVMVENIEILEMERMGMKPAYSVSVIQLIYVCAIYP